MPEDIGQVSRSSGAAARFINEPRDFSGNNDDAVFWLKRMERLKGSAKLGDDEILFVAGDHLVGKAETWFNVVGSKAKTWNEFVIAFRGHYLQDQEDKWWYQLQNIKQGDEYPSVEDLALKMQELFSLLDNRSESLQVRTFLAAIHKDIACEIEKTGTPRTFEEAKDKAKLVERSFAKYSVGPVSRQMSGENVSSAASAVVSSSGSEVASVSSVLSLVDRLEKLSINLVKLTAEVQSNKNGAAQVRRSLVCFFCNQEGHRKTECPEWLERQKNPGTGSNAVELGVRGLDSSSGKDKEYQ